jgi:hypothetical protein
LANLDLGLGAPPRRQGAGPKEKLVGSGAVKGMGASEIAKALKIGRVGHPPDDLDELERLDCERKRREHDKF